MCSDEALLKQILSRQRKSAKSDCFHCGNGASSLSHISGELLPKFYCSEDPSHESGVGGVTFAQEGIVMGGCSLTPALQKSSEGSYSLTVVEKRDKEGN